MKLPLLSILFAPALLLADEPATHLAERGNLLYSDDFKELAPKQWRIAKGKWTIADGVVTGEEIPADNHGAVMRHPLLGKNWIIQYDVKIDTANSATLSINDSKEHVARVLVYQKAVGVQKDDHDHEGPDKAIVFGRTPLPMQGQWHTVVAEFIGDTLVASVDGQHVMAGSDPLLAGAKANFGFTAGKGTASFRNLRVYEALPRPNHEEVKAKLIAATPKPAALAK